MIFYYTAVKIKLNRHQHPDVLVKESKGTELGWQSHAVIFLGNPTLKPLASSMLKCSLEILQLSIRVAFYAPDCTPCN